MSDYIRNEIENTNMLLKILIEQIKMTNEIAKQNASTTHELAAELIHIKMMFARYAAGVGQTIF
jgi:hypothetical protein